MRSNLAWIIFGLCGLACLYWITSGVRDELREDSVFYDIIEERGREADSGETLRIGVVGTWLHHARALEGVRHAVAKLNQSGGILDRPVELVEQDDKGTVEGALAAAQFFAADSSIGLVIGHTDAHLNTAVAQNYGFYKMLCISPTAPLAGSGRYAMQFSNGIAPRQLGQALLDLAASRNWQRIGLIYTKTSVNRNQARLIESMADAQLMQVPLSVAYEGQDLSRDMTNWKRELGLDAIVLSLNDTDTARLMLALRTAGLDMPLVTTSAHLPNATRSRNQSECYLLDNARSGVESFTGTVGPCSEFTLAYETVMLLAKAAEQAGTVKPESLAAQLTSLNVDPPLLSTTGFDGAGNAIKTGLDFCRAGE